MFREMRRNKQQLSHDECLDILREGKTAVVAVSGDDGYPYTVPLNYVYFNDKIYFHCAKSGHKLEAIKRCDKVSVCVVLNDDVVPEKYTTYYKSVICFGRAKIVEDEVLAQESITALGQKYCYSQDDRSIQDEIKKGMPAMLMVEITPEHISGKQCIELVK